MPAKNHYPGAGALEAKLAPIRAARNPRHAVVGAGERAAGLRLAGTLKVGDADDVEAALVGRAMCPALVLGPRRGALALLPTSAGAGRRGRTRGLALRSPSEADPRSLPAPQTSTETSDAEFPPPPPRGGVLAKERHA
eukprot:9472744-Pyramimonas_sp.AAC.1